MVDTVDIRESYDLLNVIGYATQLKRVANTGGGEWAGPCPFCGGRDRFRVEPNASGGGRWLCRSCTNGDWKDVIEYVMRRDRIDFRQACEQLGVKEPLGREKQIPKRREPTTPSPTAPPPGEWQGWAHQVVADCEAALWTLAGKVSRDWLHARGLQDSTLRRWHIGLNAGQPGAWSNLHGKSVPCGIVIPGEVEGDLWYVKVRRLEGTPKYLHVRGGHPALFLAETLAGRDVAVLTEGEFDALLLWQEAGDLAGVATLGSAAERPDMTTWGSRLLRANHWLIAYDSDEAGRTGSQKITGALPNARYVTVPTLGPDDKDLTDYHRAGGKLRDWLKFVLWRRGLITSGFGASAEHSSIPTPGGLLAALSSN